MSDTQEILELIDEAIAVRERAYAPYSGIRMGAIVIDQDGRRSAGVNVENASYGLTVCAERNAVAAAVQAGMTRMTALAVVSDMDEPVSPCGACRQVIAEFAAPDARIILANLRREYRVFTPDGLLPYVFSLKEAKEPGDGAR